MDRLVLFVVLTILLSTGTLLISAQSIYNLCYYVGVTDCTGTPSSYIENSNSAQFVCQTLIQAAGGGPESFIFVSGKTYFYSDGNCDDSFSSGIENFNGCAVAIGFVSNAAAGSISYQTSPCVYPSSTASYSSSALSISSSASHSSSALPLISSSASHSSSAAALHSSSASYSSSALSLPSSSASIPSSSASAQALGDPSIRGFNGQSFQIHGISGEIYNLISDSFFQLNSLFVFLENGRCLRDRDGSPLFVCWSHPGSYLGNLSFQTGTDVLLISSGEAELGFSEILLNHQAIVPVPNQRIQAPGSNLILQFHSIREISVKNAGIYDLIIENSDNFLNVKEIQVQSNDLLRNELKSHGIIGQPWRLPNEFVPGTEIEEIEGEVDDYAEGEKNLLGCQFKYNKFKCNA